ncbi:undecaprenyl-diphosphate phosphatase [Candidatus Vesicomyidisocius sp. SY067_SCS001]|uniref:undecaprenyl-diphosphate phosphatase n=1 Tax=Candidatus Vesicomyidisocius sp. SY067_SCS001 TaxID=2732590 RepID=UPI0016884D40|nr:undecaprenyl-diphosphate phosphatase [Candidatus Vesicomyosocius sp. SY067_SCS001]
MDVSQTIVLALIQGLSEFLPISSSAHLILVPKLTNWTDQGLVFDVVVHMGTLSAVIFYYQAMIKSLFFDFYHSIIKRQIIGQSKLAWGVLLGTIPIGLVGVIFKDFVAVDLRSIEIIAYTTLVFGLLLGFANWSNHKNKNPKSAISWIDVSFVSMMQILALIPGTSRSGITITACMLVGLSRKLSIQFSFLLSIPVITLSLILMLVDLYHQTQLVSVSLLVLGFVVSTISAYATIIFVIRLIDMVGMTPFIVYRLTLGVFLFFL